MTLVAPSLLAQALFATGDAPAAPPGTDPFVHLAWRAGVALLIGLLVGAEREHTHGDREVLFAGVRTFPLIALLGFFAALLANIASSPLVLAAATLAFGALIASTYVVTSLGDDKGATTEIAGFATFMMGAVCAFGTDAHVKLASACAVLTTVLLSSRDVLHNVIDKFEREDLYAVLKLATVTLIVLPLLPDTAYGPYSAFNPHKTWKLVVLIAAISFCGYVAVKVLGARRGVGLTGLFGGLTSSTAVTLAFSKRSVDEPAMSPAFASAIVLASTIMFIRTLVVAVGICPDLLPFLWRPVAAMTSVGVIASLALHLTGPREAEAAEKVTFKNPFELGSALKFGAIIAMIGFASRAANDLLGTQGYYVVSVVLGLADADGLAAQAATHAQELVNAAGPAGAASVPFLSTAATAGVLAMIANTAVKGTLTVSIGDKGLRRYTVPAFSALVVTGIASTLLLR